MDGPAPETKLTGSLLQARSLVQKLSHPAQVNVPPWASTGTF